MRKNNSLREIGEVLASAGRILIFTHINMDGDAAGSSGALCRTLREMGRDAWIVTEDEPADNLKFMVDGFTVSCEDVRMDDYVSICLDCSSTDRFPGRQEIFEKGSITLCVDHHMTADPVWDYCYVDPDAGATCELVFLLSEAMGWKLSPEACDCIFGGISTDTGNFQYSNTRRLTHEIACRLYDVRPEGFNHVSVAIYENESFGKLALQADILKGAELFCGGKGIIASVTQKMLEDHGCVMDDSEGVVSRMRSVEGVEVAVLLKEKEDGRIKGSMRSKTDFDVASICVSLGGGGHRKAAGFTLEMPVDEVKELIVEKVTHEFER